jgi:predicted RNase H-like nuclease
MKLSVSEATFIGIDLAWRDGNKPSGAAVLEGDRQRARLVDASLVRYADVLGYVERHTIGSTVVAIDAPLVIRNETGQRPCETLISRSYGARQASCHTSNLSL